MENFEWYDGITDWTYLIIIIHHSVTLTLFLGHSSARQLTQSIWRYVFVRSSLNFLFASHTFRCRFITFCSSFQCFLERTRKNSNIRHGNWKKWLGSIDQFRPGSRDRPGPAGVQGQRPLTSTTFTAKMSSTSIDDWLIDCFKSS